MIQLLTFKLEALSIALNPTKVDAYRRQHVSDGNVGCWCHWCDAMFFSIMQ